MLAVPKDAPHAADAMQLINFLLQPDVMAAITNKVRYANAVPASLPDDRAGHQGRPQRVPDRARRWPGSSP